MIIKNMQKRNKKTGRYEINKAYYAMLAMAVIYGLMLLTAFAIKAYEKISTLVI